MLFTLLFSMACCTMACDLSKLTPSTGTGVGGLLLPWLAVLFGCGEGVPGGATDVEDTTGIGGSPCM